MAIFPVSHGSNRMSQGVEHRGSLTRVPLALREKTRDKKHRANMLFGGHRSDEQSGRNAGGRTQVRGAEKFFWARLRGRNEGDRPSPKRRFSLKTADFRRFTPSRGGNRRKPKILTESAEPQVFNEDALLALLMHSHATTSMKNAREIPEKCLKEP